MRELRALYYRVDYKIVIILFTLLFLFGFIAINRPVFAANSQDQNNPPAAYTDGAPVSKVLHPSDGSTVTITNTGAVIKQSPNGNPYREGWINPKSVNNVSSANDLNGMISSGSSSPYTDTNSSNTSSSTTSTTSSTNTTPATTTGTVLSSSTKTTPAAALPNTGPDNIAGIAGLSTIVGTIGHFIYQRFRFNAG